MGPRRNTCWYPVTASQTSKHVRQIEGSTEKKPLPVKVLASVCPFALARRSSGFDKQGTIELAVERVKACYFAGFDKECCLRCYLRN